MAALAEVHEITGAGLARSRLQAVIARGPNPLSDAMLTEQLRKAPDQAPADHRQVVGVVVREPSLGKSRLQSESGWSAYSPEVILPRGGTPCRRAVRLSGAGVALFSVPALDAIG